ncbi:M20 family metallopeptidase [Flagellimonas meridianipacifica]|uniref:Glutamate carboxypeptidase n=1 Tax=Flagellimonas meridianipacifica TaxID=1080225 RepID=A0A2T0MAW3_9FLAO|nr:M20 family metallopeptidase [Allomuricauda pacifica]PRX54647.1 glutamate carboxypeptidase [Allomuricauda pacifica]
MTKYLAEDILKHLYENRAKMQLFLRDLVSYESPSDSLESQNEILEFIGRSLKELDFFTLRVPGKETGGYLYARPKERDKSKPLQLLVGHCDTVWDLNTILQMPIREGKKKMEGPGVYDMKAGLTQIVFALKTIVDKELAMPLTPIILINSDEEIGSVESKFAIERLAKISNRAYVLEPPLGLTGKLKTARKGLGRFTVKVKGKAAHAGLDPRKGVNAIVELSHLVQQLYAMNDFDKGITVNVGMIQGGVSPNVVAPESMAVVDVRVLNKMDGENITSRIHSLKPTLADVELSIEGGIGRPPMERTEGNQVLWKLAKEKGALLGLSLEQATAGGGSDGNTTSLHAPTLDGLGTTGDGAHAKHEFIYLEELPKRTALLTLMLLAESKNNKKD